VLWPPDPGGRSVLALAPILCGGCAEPFEPEDDQGG
jgi:hypothetical protein